MPRRRPNFPSHLHADILCRAFRRAVRVIGLAAAPALSRRLTLRLALPAPIVWRPDPGLSEIRTPTIQRMMHLIANTPHWRPPSGTFALLRKKHSPIAGRSRPQRSWEPV